jgi:ABC-type multidrug transport system fused ATPase/permease subunit
MFNGTIRQNISMWDPTMPEQEVREAARDACIDDAILSLPSAYDTLITNGGTNFSGGERQRMEIARALSRKPSFLVLDEATAALDPTTEEQIDDNLRRRGCACLIIAHRPGPTIRDCDEIILVDGGKVVERGTHDQLIAAAGRYAALAADQ